jgi:alkylation response protein AidB-like acyl-CoA dehydrogenase
MCKDETGGFTCFIVDKHCPGFTTSTPYHIMGFRGQDVRDVYLKDVRVPASNILGRKGGALKILFTISANERLVISAFMLGLAQECLSEAVKYAKERMVKDHPIAAMGQTQYMLGEMTAQIEAARWFTYRTAFLVENGVGITEYQGETAKLKVFVGRVANEVANMALQVHGAYGYTTDFKVERLYRTAKFIDVVIGSKEVMRSIAAGSLTGIY